MITLDEWLRSVGRKGPRIWDQDDLAEAGDAKNTVRGCGPAARRIPAGTEGDDSGRGRSGDPGAVGAAPACLPGLRAGLMARQVRWCRLGSSPNAHGQRLLSPNCGRVREVRITAPPLPTPAVRELYFFPMIREPVTRCSRKDGGNEADYSRTNAGENSR